MAESLLWDDRPAPRGRPAPNLTHGQRYKRFSSWSESTDNGTADLHTANLAGGPLERPYFIVYLREIPFGALGRAALVALMTAAVVWISGAVFPGFGDVASDPMPTAAVATPTGAAASTAAATPVPDNAPAARATVTSAAPTGDGASTATSSASPSPAATVAPSRVSNDEEATDVVAFLLGIPAVVGAWLAFATGRRKTFTSVTARCSVATSAALSGLAAYLYLLHVRHPDYAVSWPNSTNVLFVPEVRWTVLLVLALGNLAVTLAVLFIRNRQYVTRKETTTVVEVIAR